MVDSARAWARRDGAALRARLAADGYVLVRGALPAEDSVRARAAALRALAALAPPRCAPQFDAATGVAASGAARLGLLGAPGVSALPPVARLLASPVLFDLAAAALGCDAVLTPRFKWLRCVAPGEHTGVHCDATYVAGRFVTLWVPLGRVSVENGALLVAVGSHSGASRRFGRARDAVGALALGGDGTSSGWIATHATELGAAGLLRSPGVEWVTADCAPGDVIVLHANVIHQTLVNRTRLVRTSADTRWAAAGEPRDGRIGDWRDARGERVGAHELGGVL